MDVFTGTTKRMIGIAVFAAAFFVAGISVGYYQREEVERVTGVFNTTFFEENASSSALELRICIDAQGVEVPCLRDHDKFATEGGPPADFGQFWKAWNVINERYIPPKKGEYPTNQEKVWGAIAGLADSLGDPYTFFLPPQEKLLFEQDVSGSFGGVGMQIGIREGQLTVIAPLKGSPAERAGIEKGDYILAIDGATTSEMTIDKALYLIRGPVGKPVTLTLYRDGREKPFETTLVREIIEVPTIDTKTQDGVFIISVYGFPATGADLFRKALREFVESGTGRLIVDLRGNPGGYLEVAVDMASWFLPEGKVIVREEEKDGSGRVFRSRGYNVFGDNFHFVVLVDGGSASASEIFAGALQDHGRATIIGTKTFGKGSVQELIPITEDTALKVTVARWLTPSGRSLSDAGIDPDIVVELTQEDTELLNDPQLKKAIEVARGIR